MCDMTKPDVLHDEDDYRYDDVICVSYGMISYFLQFRIRTRGRQRGKME